MKLSVFASLILASTISFANQTSDIKELLKEYQTTSQTSSKTKKESLGHAIVFSQNDLKMMQAHKLSDILKIIPVTSMQTNLFGVSNLTYSGNPNGVSTSMRLYINNHEVSSLQTLSPWLIYEAYPLDHVSHIEIYIGEGSLTLGNEPSNLTIKLYTKKPELLNGSDLRASFASNDSSSASLVYGDETSEATILAMLNNSSLNKSKTAYNNSEIQNDSDRIFGYFSVAINDYIIDTGYAKLKKDTFVGLAKDAAPDDGQIKSADYFISATKNFDDNSGKLYFAIDKNDRKFKEINGAGSLVLPVINMVSPLSTIPKSYSEDLTLTKYDLSASKDVVFNNNHLILGTSFKRKEYEINNRELIALNGNNIHTQFSDIKNESILSAMVEDNYYFDDKNMLILDFKYDKFYKNGDFKDISETSRRIGFVSMLNENFGIKTFATKSFTPPSMYEIDFAAGTTTQDKDLKNESKKIYSLEGVYEDAKNKLSLYTNYVEIEDSIILDLSKLGYVNSDAKFNGGGFNIDYKRKFDAQNEINLNLYRFHSSAGTYKSPRQGAIVRAFQKLENFDFYEELIFKDGYKYGGHTDIEDSYNLSLGINYHISKDIVISLKGENLLDDDMDVVYSDMSNLASVKYITIPNSNRTTTASIKWSF